MSAAPSLEPTLTTWIPTTFPSPYFSPTTEPTAEPTLDLTVGPTLPHALDASPTDDDIDQSGRNLVAATKTSDAAMVNVTLVV